MSNYFLNVLDEAGNFEILDGDFLFLYGDINPEQLHELTAEEYARFQALRGLELRWQEGNFLPVIENQPPSQYHQWNGTEWTLTEESLNALIADQKSELMNALIAKTDAFKNQFLAEYSQTEIDSFYRQEQEARGNLDLLLLPELVAGREDIDDIETLKAKVIEKADIFAIVTGKLLAQKQNLEIKITNAQTIEELNQIAEELNQWTTL